MKKFFLIAALCAVLMTTGCVSIEKVDKNLKGDTYLVCYETVNVRSGPDTDYEIVGEKSLGVRVTLTGNVVEYPGYEVNSRWVEIDEGWITADAVMSEDEFKWKFGGF